MKTNFMFNPINTDAFDPRDREVVREQPARQDANEPSEIEETYLDDLREKDLIGADEFDPIDDDE